MQSTELSQIFWPSWKLTLKPSVLKHRIHTRSCPHGMLRHGPSHRVFRGALRHTTTEILFSSVLPVSKSQRLACGTTTSTVKIGSFWVRLGGGRLISFVFVWLLVVAAALPLVDAMRLVVQRVKSASVTVDNKVVSSIGPGMMALVGLHEHDTEADLTHCCKRLLGAKLWSNDNGALWRHGVKQRGHEVLLVSQFTLYGTLTKKNQPDYKRSMKAIPAQALYNQFLQMVRDQYEAEKVFDGVFGAMMDVELVNDGPVTIIIESDPQPPPKAEEEEE